MLSHPFLIDAIVFAVFGALLGALLYVAYAGNPAEQVILCGLVVLPVALLSLALAAKKRSRRTLRPQ